MNYNELIQLYFERALAMQSYWNLYVIIVGGILAFSSLRKQPAAITTLIVSILFALFAFKNLDAMHDVTAQRFATLDAIKGFDPGGAVASHQKVRDLLEPTLTPATYGSVQDYSPDERHSDNRGLWAMELRRRRLHGTPRPWPESYLRREDGILDRHVRLSIRGMEREILSGRSFGGEDAAFYSERFATTEVNYTFHRIPRPRRSKTGRHKHRRGFALV